MDYHLVVPRPRGAIGPPKRTIRAIREFVEDDGPPPDELLEVRLISEFGWTLEELDAQDEARALRLLAARNIEGAVRHVTEAVRGHRVDSIPVGVWRLFKLAGEDAEENAL